LYMKPNLTLANILIRISLVTFIMNFRETLLQWRAIFRDIPIQIWQKHLLLFAATFFSMMWTYYSFSPHLQPWDKFLDGLMYSLTLIVILLSHELGHYMHARQYGVETTLPFFIPMPFLSPFGTLGAFIRMKSLPPDKRALFDISYWGPAMSFFTSIPAIIAGLLLSNSIPTNMPDAGLLVGKNDLVFGSSLLFEILIKIFVRIPDGYALVLHPVAFAGWVGLFVTAINLFPIGQLDGGHIAYVFLGKRQKYIAYLFFSLLVFLALSVSSGWMFWIFMLFMMGLKHPVTRILEAGIHVDKTRIRRSLLAAIIFIICFIPEPIKMNLRMQIPSPETRPNDESQFRDYHEIKQNRNNKFTSNYFQKINFFSGQYPWK